LKIAKIKSLKIKGCILHLTAYIYVLAVICENCHEKHLTTKLTMRIFFILFFFSVIVGCLSCKEGTRSTRQNTNISFFDPMEFGATNPAGRLSIEARFSECGEWGGHKEEVIIYADSTERFHADYRVFPYNCDSLPFYLANYNVRPIVSKSIIVQENEKKAIIGYIQRLIQSKINERLVDGASNAGNVFSIVNSDSTFFLSVRNSKETDADSYKQFIRELFG
jgi:hypothetical protein